MHSVQLPKYDSPKDKPHLSIPVGLKSLVMPNIPTCLFYLINFFFYIIYGIDVCWIRSICAIRRASIKVLVRAYKLGLGTCQSWPGPCPLVNCGIILWRSHFSQTFCQSIITKVQWPSYDGHSKIPVNNIAVVYQKGSVWKSNFARV